MSFPPLQGCTAIRIRADGSIEALAGAQIDADGANGQNGLPPAYAPPDFPGPTLDDVANAGHPGDWWGLMTDDEGTPLIQSAERGDPCPGAYVSTTGLVLGTLSRNDPRHYVDAAAVPGIVVPKCVIDAVEGDVLGCYVRATNELNKAVADAVVYDVGPDDQFGEISVALARRLGIPADARTGGEDRPIIRYEIYPGKPAVVDGVTYALQAS